MFCHGSRMLCCLCPSLQIKLLWSPQLPQRNWWKEKQNWQETKEGAQEESRKEREETRIDDQFVYTSEYDIGIDPKGIVTSNFFL